VVWVAEFHRHILLASSGDCLKIEVVCIFGNCIHTRLFDVSAEGDNFSAFELKMKSRNGRGIGFGME
jgi:hypothetical protein